MPWPRGITENDFGFGKVTCMLCLDGTDFRHDSTCVIYCCHTDVTVRCPTSHYCRCGRTD